MLPIDEPPGGRPAGHLDVQWDPWRPDQVASLPQSVTAPWYVAGGWALLPARARGWLRQQLSRLHPGHAWNEAL
jgi:hypothetical protein